jgi:hypothetical protein
METNIIIPINVYNDLPQWQKNELYDAAKWVYHPDYKGVTSVVFYLGEGK